MDQASPKLQLRQMTLSPAHLAKVARKVEAPGGPPLHTELNDADMEAAARQKLDELAGGPFWVFAFGSLIWKPAFEVAEARRAVAPGWRRSFCLHMEDFRATPEEPGLMLGLEPGGSCVGVVYRMPDDATFDRMLRLLRREIAFHVHLSELRWLRVRAGGETIRALTFCCAARVPDSVYIRLPIEEQARRLARAVGPAGSCAEYLHNTVDHLEALGIRDRYLWAMQKMVAAEIEALPARE